MRPAAAAALAALVALQVAIGLVYSRAVGQFSPAAAVAAAEGVKLAFSAAAHAREVRGGRARAVPAGLLGALPAAAALTLMYSANNQLSWALYARAEPQTIAAAKASTPMLTAAAAALLPGGAPLGALRWRCVLLVCLGLLLLALDGGKDVSTEVSWEVGGGLALGALLSATASAWNASVLQRSALSLPVQSMLLYACGLAVNGAGAVAAGADWGALLAPLPLAVVALNALMGLAVSAVYKLLDAVAKAMASSATLAVLTVVGGGAAEPVQCVAVAVVVVAAEVFFRL